MKYYYLYDGLGSVTELIDGNENVMNTYRYTPFGSPLIRNETVYNPYQFTGRRYDNESGMYYYRARMYSPNIGRFMQADPAGMMDGANMYAYAGNDPVVRVDPSGMWWNFRLCTLYASYLSGQVKHNNQYIKLRGGAFHRGHFYVGCKLARIGCSYDVTHAIAQSYEILRKNVFGEPSNPHDVSATMWGWDKSGIYKRNSCMDITLNIFFVYETDYNRARGINLMLDPLPGRTYTGWGPTSGGRRLVPTRM